MLDNKSPTSEALDYRLTSTIAEVRRYRLKKDIGSKLETIMDGIGPCLVDTWVDKGYTEDQIKQRAKDVVYDFAGKNIRDRLFSQGHNGYDPLAARLTGYNNSS